MAAAEEEEEARTGDGDGERGARRRAEEVWGVNSDLVVRQTSLPAKQQSEGAATKGNTRSSQRARPQSSRRSELFPIHFSCQQASVRGTTLY